MRKQIQQIVESTMTEGVSVIRSIEPKKKEETNTKKKLRVAAYCRVSKDIEEQESSLATQMSTYNRIISQHPDWELVEIYKDKGKTGTNTKKRLDFNRMLDDAKEGKIDLILVKSVSRFSRNTVDLLESIRSLKEMGVGVFFEKEKINTSALNSELLITVFVAFAQEESFSISENMRRGMRQRFKLGIPKVSKVYGYDNLERGVLSINKKNALVVKRIFNMYLKGLSTLEIAETLNRESILPPIETGKKWYPTSVKCILQNEKYIGDSLMQKYYTSNHLEHDSTPNKDLVVEQYYKENTHPAIIERELYIDVNRIIMMRDLKRGANQYPYYGYLLCPYCGSPMVRVNTGRGKIPSSWICGGKNKGEYYAERTKCPLYFIKEPYLSNSVLTAILNLDDKTVAIPIQNELKKKHTIQYIHLKKLIASITFKDWNTLKVIWNWGEETTVPYIVHRLSDYPVQTIETINDKDYIGPFPISPRLRNQLDKTNKLIKEKIMNLRIIDDNTHRFPCPPLIEKGEKQR